jgi:two-component system cell cycle response regulator
LNSLPTILIVDDEKEMLEVLKRAFAKVFVVFTAVDARSALAVLSAKAIQLVISDVVMPGMNGLQFCREIKSRAELSHIPVILLTVRDSVQARVDGLQQGADAYIGKPFSLQYLRAQVFSLIANRSRVREHFLNSPTGHIGDVMHTRTEKLFLESLNRIVHANIQNTGLDILVLADSLSMSRSSLYRKVKALCNLSPVQFIYMARLNEAARLLAEGDLRIYDIALMTGFSTQSNFTRNFKKRFKVSPSQFRNRAKSL